MRLRTLCIPCGLLFVLTACGQSSGQSASVGTTPVVQISATASPKPAASSASAAGPVQIALVTTGPDEAVIQLQNTGGPNAAATIELDGWSLVVGSTATLLPSTARIAAGGSLFVHTGSPPGTTPTPSAATPPNSSRADQDLYLGPTGATFRQVLQPAAQVQLVDAKGVIVSLYVMP